MNILFEYILTKIALFANAIIKALLFFWGLKGDEVRASL